MVNTVNNQPAAVSFQLTDYFLLWQGGQSPSTRKLAASGLSTYWLPLTGGTLSGGVTVSSGGITVTGNSTITGTLRGITGLTVASGGATITAGGLTVTSGGITATGNSTITGALGGLTGLTVASGGLTVTGNSTITGTLGGIKGLTVASGGASVTGGVTVATGGLTVSASGATITGNSTITGTLGGLTGLTVASGGASIAGTSDLSGALNVHSAATTLTGGGTTGATVTLRVQNATAGGSLLCSDNGAVTLSSLGSFTTASAANVTWDGGTGLLQLSTSSARYKRDITTLTDMLAAARKLRPVRFRSRAENDGDTVFAGLIAEELHDAGLTEFVSYDPEGRPNAIHYGPLSALALGAVVELADALDALATRVAALESA